MTKAELIKALAHSKQMSVHEATEILDFITDTITETVANGDKVVITGFGSFSTVYAVATTRNNPKTGEKIEVQAHKRVHFKAGTVFKEAVNK